MQARRDGRLWSAVLVVSALALIASVTMLVTDHRAAAQLPQEEQLVIADPAATPAPQTQPTATPRAATPQAPRGWSTRSARPPAVSPAATPERLIIPAIDVSVPIESTGVDRHGAMALPERPDRAGWYALGPAPGDRTGSAVIAAHVDSDRYGTGPLAGLAELDKGDIVRVEGKRDVEFRVIAVQRISKRSLDTEALFDRTGRPLLRVVTCGGDFDPKTGYEDNVVVTAVPT